VSGARVLKKGVFADRGESFGRVVVRSESQTTTEGKGE